MNEKKKILIGNTFNEGIVFKEFSKTVFSSLECRPSLMDALVEVVPPEHSFSNFTSVIVRPTGDGFFRDFLSRLTNAVDIGALRQRIPSKRELHESNRSAETRFEAFPSKSESSAFALSKEVFLLKLCERFGDKILFADFGCERLLRNESESLRTIIAELENCERIANECRFRILSSQTHYLRSDIPSLDFQRSIDSVEFKAIRLRRVLGEATCKIQIAANSLHLKALKKRRLKGAIKLLNLISLARKAERKAKDLIERKSYDCVECEFENIVSSIAELRLTSNALTALRERVTLLHRRFCAELTNIILSDLLDSLNAALNRFEEFLEGKTCSALSTEYSPPSLLLRARVFCPSHFIEEFRGQIGDSVRRAHSVYARIIVRPNFALKPSKEVFEAYKVSMERVFCIHRSVIGLVGESEESNMFSKLLAKQANRFIKALIDGFDFGGFAPKQLFDSVFPLIAYSESLGIPSPLPMHFARNFLSFRQQTFLSTLQSVFESEEWAPTALSDDDRAVLSRLNPKNRNWHFFRCFLHFAAHIDALAESAKSFSEIQSESARRVDQTVELLIERFDHLLVKGYATDYKRLAKINTKVLSLAIVQLDFLKESLCEALSGETAKLDSNVEKAIECFLNKIVFVMRAVIERNAFGFFEALRLGTVAAPSAQANEVVRSVRQLSASISGLLSPKRLFPIVEQVKSIFERSYASRIRATLSNCSPIIENALKTEIKFLSDSLSEEFARAISAFESEIN